MKREKRYYDLLRQWCDGLLSVQIPENGRSTLSGGFLCPACRRIHGRSADAILAMMYMAKRTGEQKYLDSAKALFRWSDSMYQEPGCYINDIDNSWTGITVFFSTQLGESLLWFSELLSEAERSLWMERFFRTADYVRDCIDRIGGTINYPAAGAYNLALAGILSAGEARERYFVRARELAEFVCDHILPDGLIFGEGHPPEVITKKGHRAIDLGYNMEETIPSLLEYAHIMADVNVENMARQALMTHLKFYLPDGGLDNSFGSRSYKWSYWGSRTSDGIQAAAELVGDRFQLFEKIAEQNVLLLQSCTHNGLLYGGPMFLEAGEEPCVHHTFCHAKNLAKALIYRDNASDHLMLPEQEPADGMEYFPELGTWLIRNQSWRGTVTDYEYQYAPGSHASGGALTLLWHRDVGPIFAGTMNRYHVVEPNNMQILLPGKDSCLTPRLEYRKDGMIYSSIQDLSAELHPVDDGMSLLAAGKLVTEEQTGEEGFRIRYVFDEDCLMIHAWSSAEAELILPVIAGKEDTICFDFADTVSIRKQTGEISVCANGRLNKMAPSVRRFNPVGGFLAYPVIIPVSGGNWISVKLSVKR